MSLSLRTPAGQKARRDKWRAAGLCTSCGHKVETPPKCDDCRARSRRAVPAREAFESLKRRVDPAGAEKWAAVFRERIE